MHSIGTCTQNSIHPKAPGDPCACISIVQTWICAGIQRVATCVACNNLAFDINCISFTALQSAGLYFRSTAQLRPGSWSWTQSAGLFPWWCCWSLWWMDYPQFQMHPTMVPLQVCTPLQYVWPLTMRYYDYHFLDIFSEAETMRYAVQQIFCTIDRSP